MSKVQWKGSTLLSPLPPAMVTCRDGGRDNVLTIGWTGILNSQPPKTYISVRPERFSYEMIASSRVFAVNLTTTAMVRAADFCGVRSGKDLDKFAKCHMERVEASLIDCPLLADAPISLECRVTDIVHLGSHDMFLADIVAVDVNEELLDSDGKLHIEKASLAAYAHGSYYALGKKIGSFGYSVKKKRKPNGKNR